MGLLVSTEQFKGMCQIVIYIPSGETRSPVTLLSSSLTRPRLESALGHSGKTYESKGFFFFFFFNKQEMGVTEQLLCLERPHRVLLGFNPPFSLILFNPEGNSCGTRKKMKSSIEGLTTNSV